MSSLATPKRQLGKRTAGFLMAFPAIFWMVFFFLLPLIIVLIYSFLTPARGGGTLPLTTDAYTDVFGNIYFRVVLRSIFIAFVTTVICLLVGYPLGFFISTRKSSMMRNLTLFLVILPFWTNFLVRTYAWRVVLGQEGVINNSLMALGMIQEPLDLLFTRGAVMIGLIYGFLPFMVLPIYASIERFDFRLVEAAHDLGANDWSAFWRVVLPGTLPGVIAGSILVFIPSIGAYVTPDLLGGTRGLMIGNLIQRQFAGTGNWPRGSALSIVLMGIVLIALLIYSRFGNQEEATS